VLMLQHRRVPGTSVSIITDGSEAFGVGGAVVYDPASRPTLLRCPPGHRGAWYAIVSRAVLVAVYCFCHDFGAATRTTSDSTIGLVSGRITGRMSAFFRRRRKERCMGRLCLGTRSALVTTLLHLNWQVGIPEQRKQSH